jgi:outer membrane protein
MRTLFSIIFSVVALAGFAQTQPAAQKIGYADWTYIFSQMPEFKQIDSELKAHRTQLETQMEAKQKDLETKYKAYQALPSTTPDAIRADKTRELEQMQESIQKFTQDAQASLQNKQNTLMEPIFNKVGKAIEETAKENGFAFIISPQSQQGEDILLYSDEKYDISTMVLKKLGITATKPQAPVKP